MTDGKGSEARASKAPRILGMEMAMRQPGERQYSVRFGAVEAGYACIPNLDGSESAPFNWWVRLVKHECQRSNVFGSERAAALAIAAIERELLAIREAIPARGVCPGSGKSAEPQDPTNEALIETMRTELRAPSGRRVWQRKDGENEYVMVNPGLLALAELERREAERARGTK